MPPMHKGLPKFMSRHGAQHIGGRFQMLSWRRRAWSVARGFGVSDLRKREVQLLWQRMTALSDFVISFHRVTKMPAKWSARLQRFMFSASIGGRERVGHFAIALCPKPGGEVTSWSRFGCWHRIAVRGVFTKRWDLVLMESQRRRRHQMRANYMRLDFTDGWPNKSPEPTAVGAVSSAIAVHVASRRWLSFLR